MKDGNPLQEILQRSLGDSERLNIEDLLGATPAERQEMRDTEWPAQVLVAPRRR